MGFGWWDIAQIAVPIAATAVGGPVGGIAASALMSGGGTAAKGGSLKDILISGGIGAGTGALGAGAAGAIGKNVGTAAKGAVEKGMDVGVNEVIKANMGAMAKEGISAGAGELTDAALKTGTDAFTKGVSQGARLDKVAGLFDKAKGQDPDTQQLLKTVGSGAKMLGTANSAYDQFTKPPSFTNVMSAAHPGMNPSYQYGSGNRRTKTLSFMGGY